MKSLNEGDSFIQFLTRLLLSVHHTKVCIASVVFTPSSLKCFWWSQLGLSCKAWSVLALEQHWVLCALPALAWQNGPLQLQTREGKTSWTSESAASESSSPRTASDQHGPVGQEPDQVLSTRKRKKGVRGKSKQYHVTKENTLFRVTDIQLSAKMSLSLLCTVY